MDGVLTAVWTCTIQRSQLGKDIQKPGDVPMKATTATQMKLIRRSKSGRWEDVLLLVDEEGDDAEGLSPAPDGARAICCRVFIARRWCGARESRGHRPAQGSDCVGKRRVGGRRGRGFVVGL